MAAGLGLAWGDIRLVDFEQPDKRRPVLVLTRTSAIPVLHAITVAPVTRTIRGIPTELRVGIAEGLKGESVVNLDSIQTVSKERVGRYVGSIARNRKMDLRLALLFALELDAE